MRIDQARKQGEVGAIHDSGLRWKRQVAPNGSNRPLLYEDGVSKQDALAIKNAYLLKNGRLSPRECSPSSVAAT
jgi:hypothetical protein